MSAQHDDAPAAETTPQSPRKRRRPGRRRKREANREAPPWPMPAPVSVGPSVRLYGGEHHHRWLTQQPGRGWPLWRRGDRNAEHANRDAAAALLRSATDHGGVYLLARLPADPAGYGRQDQADAYVHSTALAEHHLVWEAVALALCGTHLGRALTGQAKPRADEILAALLDAGDDLIRLRIGDDRRRRRSRSATGEVVTESDDREGD